MGNCIGSARALCPGTKKVSPDEDDQELKIPEVVAGKINPGCSGPLPLSALLGDLQHSLQVQLDTPDTCKRMKIVVNKKQLQLLKKSLEELKLSHVVIQSVRGKKGRRKWKPSLSTIPEL